MCGLPLDLVTNQAYDLLQEHVVDRFTLTVIVNLQDLDAVADWLKADNPDIWELFGCELPPCILLITTTVGGDGGSCNGIPVLLFRFSEKNYIDDIYWESLSNGILSVMQDASQLSLFTVSLLQRDAVKLPEVGRAVKWFAARFVAMLK